MEMDSSLAYFKTRKVLLPVCSTCHPISLLFSTISLLESIVCKVTFSTYLPFIPSTTMTVTSAVRAFVKVTWDLLVGFLVNFHMGRDPGSCMDRCVPHRYHNAQHTTGAQRVFAECVRMLYRIWSQQHQVSLKPCLPFAPMMSLVLDFALPFLSIHSSLPLLIP